MAEGVAWVLNLDADLELARPERYEPTTRVLAAMVPHAERLAESLIAPGEVWVTDASPPGSAGGRVGRAFCPTSRALRLLERAGATPEPHPSLEVLRAVNSRAFCAELGQALPGAAFVRDVDLAVAKLRERPPVGEDWRCKGAFGMAGRGQRIQRPGAVDATMLATLRARVAEGGMQIEPNVKIEAEYGLHGFVSVDGGLALGKMVTQTCDARGAWLSTALAAGPADVEAALVAEAQRVAEALRNAGYFGPFGIDAFTYRDADGALALQPKSEINARYSMGFAVGFGPPATLAR